MRTIPGLAREMDVEPEALRSFIRRRPALRALGLVLGMTRVLTPAEARRIRTAFEKRRSFAN